jgi:predicted ABC-type ATPase
MPEQPEMVLVCGSNGAGKSTFTRAARDAGGMQIPVIDPDEVSKGIDAPPDRVLIETGRKVAETIKQYTDEKRSFARESTLSSKFDMKMLNEAKENGFKTSLVYVCVGDAQKAVDRVAHRHAQGGHTVPENDIKRRYSRSLEYLPEAIKLVDKATLYDNRGASYKEVATFEKGKLKTHDFTPEWFKKPLKVLKESENSVGKI